MTKLTELPNDTRLPSMLYRFWIQEVIGLYVSSTLTTRRTCVRPVVIPTRILTRTDVNYHGFGWFSALIIYRMIPQRQLRLTIVSKQTWFLIFCILIIEL